MTQLEMYLILYQQMKRGGCPAIVGFHFTDEQMIDITCVITDNISKRIDEGDIRGAKMTVEYLKRIVYTRREKHSTIQYV